MLGAGISNCIVALRRQIFSRRPSLAIKAFGQRLWRPPVPRSTLDSRRKSGLCVPASVSGARAPVDDRCRQVVGVTASRHACRSQGRPRAAVGPRPLCRRPAGPGRHAARPRHPLAASARRHRAHRRRRGAGEGRRLGGHHRRGRQEDFRSVPGGAEGADASMVARGRSRALRRRAGGAGGGREPLSRRGRRRAGADRIRAARGGDRSARGLQAVGADPARRSQDQRDFGPQIPLRRHQERVREGRQDRQADGRLSPAVVHADGVLRRRRARTIRPTTATTAWRTSRVRSARIR